MINERNACIFTDCEGDSADDDKCGTCGDEGLCEACNDGYALNEEDGLCYSKCKIHCKQITTVSEQQLYWIIYLEKY